MSKSNDNSESAVPFCRSLLIVYSNIFVLSLLTFSLCFLFINILACATYVRRHACPQVLGNGRRRQGGEAVMQRQVPIKFRGKKCYLFARETRGNPNGGGVEGQPPPVAALEVALYSSVPMLTTNYGVANSHPDDTS